MEYRQFGKQPRQLKKSTETQEEKVVFSRIYRRGDRDAVRRTIEQRALKAPKFPPCNAMHIRRYA